MDVRMTGIIGRASAVRINYWKWVGPSIATTDPLHSEFQVWCFSVTWFWSYRLPKPHNNATLMFIRCGIPKIELFCLLPSTKNFR